MISTSELDKIFADLEAFRGNGREDLHFDSRDRGNYGAYSWEGTRGMLRRADPVGLAEAMLLQEMVEATLHGSKVVLHRLLREEGFLDHLKQILLIKERVTGLIAGRDEALRMKVTTALASISSDFGEPSAREVAICLRDAIYCTDAGLKLRWLVCDGTPLSGPVPLAEEVRQFGSIAEFIDALRVEMPFGAHLARIGRDFTAIGIKQPGRIAYLSSLGIDTRSGQTAEDRAHGTHMAEAFDLDTAVQRYPEWVKVSGGHGYGSTVVTTGATDHQMHRLSLVPRDRLIWFAMTVELAVQRMAQTRAEDVCLTEALGNVLPGERTSNLPAVIKPNFVIDTLTVEGMLDTLDLSEWEMRFLAPALERLTADTFLPQGAGLAGFRLDRREPCLWPADIGSMMSLSQREDIRENAVRFTTVGTDWVGSKAEIDDARKIIFGRNLVNYLLAWGNREFAALWGQSREWFTERLKRNLPAALSHPSVYLVGIDHYAGSRVNLYHQSPRHKTYNPRCYFNPKSQVTHSLLVHPDTSEDLVGVLGLESEADLPERLRGWRRKLGWSTTDRHSRGTPYGTTERWDFRRRFAGSQRTPSFEGVIRVNEKNCDISKVQPFEYARDDD